ncbi:MAG: Crp/Fnr family transcriptional regulator [Acidobacteriota bacterium]
MSRRHNREITESCSHGKFCADRLFSDLPRKSLDAFEALKSVRLYPKGVLFFLEGQPPLGVYLLCTGRVKVSIAAPKKKTRILRIAEPGEFLGLSATISGYPYEVTAEALEPCQAHFVKREDFLRFLCQHGEVCLRVVQLLACNLRDAYQQVRLLSASHSPAHKLAKVLLAWCGEHGDNTPHGISLKTVLTQEEAAQLIGVSRETVTRLLGEFKSRKIISLKGSTLLVHNRAALESMASPQTPLQR